MSNNKTPITIVKNEDIFKYLESLRVQGAKIYVLDFDNFDDFIVEIKCEFQKKGEIFDCVVFGKKTYTDSIIEDDFKLIDNDEFSKVLIDYIKNKVGQYNE